MPATPSIGHVLVTGGAGYLGAHVVLALKQRGLCVTSLDDLSSGHGAFGDLADTFVRLDLRDRSAIEALLRGRQYGAVVHLAGRGRVDAGLERPEVCYEVNVGGTAALLGAIRASRVRRLVFVSDRRGRRTVPPDGRSPEDGAAAPSAVADHWLGLDSPCAETGQVIEHLVGRCRRGWSLEAVGLRLPTLGGADTELRAGDAEPPFYRWTTRLVRAAVRPDPQRPIPVGTRDADDASARFEVLHVSDAAEAVAMALERHASVGDDPWVLDLGATDLLCAPGWVSCLERLAGVAIPTVRAALPPGLGGLSPADTALTQRVLGWRPEQSQPKRVLATALAFERARRAKLRAASNRDPSRAV